MSSAREAEGLPAGGGTPATITPEFAVLGVEVVEDAAAPTLRFRLGVSEPSQREIFTIALTAQINVEPARRDHDAATRERLVDLFGEPERWPATTHPFLWAQATTLVPTFTGAGMFTLARAEHVRPRDRGGALLREPARTATCRSRSTSAARS